MAYNQLQIANPRRSCCYKDEDMVGKMKRIVRKGHASTAAHRALELYIILVGARRWTLLAQLRGA